jgi:hypothetical protein
LLVDEAETLAVRKDRSEALLSIMNRSQAGRQGTPM